MAVVHALISTLVLGGFVELIAAQGLLGWLETRMAAFITAATAGLSGSLPGESDLAALPRILVIDDNSYERDFNRASPLDRGQLLSLLQPVLQKKPAVVAIDLDLAPSSRAEAIQARPLYNAICRAARPDLQQHVDRDCLQLATQKTIESCSTGTRFALIEPFHAKREETNAAIADWRNEMRAALFPCLRFARPDIHLNHGRAILFNPDHPSLGVVAHGLRDGTLPPEESISPARESEYPINPRVFRLAGLDIELEDSRSRFITGIPDADLSVHLPMTDPRNQVVFVGGSWGLDDKHGTAIATQVDGVFIHAAIFDSLNRPITTSKMKSFLLDFLSGMITGLLFDYILGRYRAARRAVRQSDVRPELLPLILMPPSWSAFGQATLWLMAAWVLFIGSVIGVFWIAMHQVAGGNWINPSGIIFGMFLERAISGGEPEEDKSKAAPRTTVRLTPVTVIGGLAWMIRTLSMLGLMLYGLLSVFHN